MFCGASMLLYNIKIMAENHQFNRMKQCRHGLMLYNIHDDCVGRSLDLYGEFSQSETDLFQHFLRPGDFVLDVGANIGCHTLHFAKAVGPTGKVLAFEPQRILFQTLCANMALNSVTNVYCYQVGLADKQGTMQTPPVNYAAGNNFGGLSLGQYPNGEIVEVIRLDNFKLPSCRLIKLDVEGMELQALQGASALLEKHKPVLYVENDRAENSDALIRHIDAAGYAMHWHYPPMYNPDNFLKNPTNVFGRMISKNMVCLHKSVPINLKGLEPVAIP